MTKQQFHVQRINALDCTDFDQFLAECGSSMPEEYFADGVDIVASMRQIWDLAFDFSFRRLKRIHGDSLRTIAQEYSIPLRSLEDWNTSKSAPPEYVLEFLAADVLSNRIPMLATKKTYYLPTTDWDTFFGIEHPVCIDETERNRLAAEWGLDVAEDFREATKDDIAEYGVCES